jgi:hypothetical protein
MLPLIPCRGRRKGNGKGEVGGDEERERKEERAPF